MSLGIWQLLLIAVVAILLFGGRGRISSIMGDLAKGINSFRKGLKETDENQENLDPDDIVNITPGKDKSKTSDGPS